MPERSNPTNEQPPDLLWEELANLAKQARKQQKLSQSELAASAHVERSRINRFENFQNSRGKGRLTRETLYLLRAALGSGLNDLGAFQRFSQLADEVFRFERRLALEENQVEQSGEGPRNAPALDVPALFVASMKVIGKDSTSARNETDWLKMVRNGRDLAKALDFQAATICFRAALEAARDPSAKALVLAEHSFPFLGLNLLDEAWKFTDKALFELEKLEVSDGFPDPERDRPIDIEREIISPLRLDQTALEAYCRLAAARVYVYDANQDYGTQYLAIETMENLARALDDKSNLAEALQMKARVLREKATTVVFEEGAVGWRRKQIGADRLLRKAVRSLQQAQKVRPDEDWGGRANDWRNEALVRYLLGEHKQALLAEGAALEVYRNRPQLLNLQYDQATVAIANAEHRLAEDLLLRVSFEANRIQSPDMLARSLASLGLLYSTLALSSQERRRAMDCFAASLIAWPQSYKPNEKKIVQKMLKDVGYGEDDGDNYQGLWPRGGDDSPAGSGARQEYGVEPDWFMENADRFPFSLLRGMPNLAVHARRPDRQ